MEESGLAAFQFLVSNIHNFLTISLGLLSLLSDWNTIEQEKLYNEILIRYWAREYHIEEELVLNIAKAESQLSTKIKNPSSSASGLFQFLDGTFVDYCIEKYKLAESLENKNDPLVQTKCAMEIIKEPSGLIHWSASYPWVTLD